MVRSSTGSLSRVAPRRLVLSISTNVAYKVTESDVSDEYRRGDVRTFPCSRAEREVGLRGKNASGMEVDVSNSGRDIVVKNKRCHVEASQQLVLEQCVSHSRQCWHGPPNACSDNVLVASRWQFPSIWSPFR